MSKTIAIIGAGEGVGLALARRFGREGFQTALLARNPDKTNALADQLAAEGIEAQAFQADVLDRQALVSALGRVADRFGPIDVMEYSPVPAGPFSPPRALGVEEQAYHLDINVLGPIAAVQAVLPDMMQRKTGTLLFTGAPSAQRPLIMTAPFGIAMGGLVNYVRLLNRDLAPDGVFAGFVAIAGIVIPPGQDDSPAAAYFPAETPRVRAEDIADLHWRLHVERQEFETVIGDLEGTYALPGFR